MKSAAKSLKLPGKAYAVFAGIEYRQQSIWKHLLYHVNEIHKKSGHCKMSHQSEKQSEIVKVTAEGANHRAECAREDTENAITKLCC